MVGASGSLLDQRVAHSYDSVHTKYCIKWLPMLYYKCRRLNGLGSPFGIPQKIPLEWVGPQKLEKGKKTLRRTGVVEFLLVGIRISCAM